MADIQYANLYFARAALMNKRLLETIQRAWPNTRSEPLARCLPFAVTALRWAAPAVAGPQRTCW